MMRNQLQIIKMYRPALHMKTFANAFGLQLRQNFNHCLKQYIEADSLAHQFWNGFEW